MTTLTVRPLPCPISKREGVKAQRKALLDRVVEAGFEVDTKVSPTHGIIQPSREFAREHFAASRLRR